MNYKNQTTRHKFIQFQIDWPITTPAITNKQRLVAYQKRKAIHDYNMGVWG